MLFIYRLAVGFVRVIFYGEFSEKILNLAARNRITLWDSRLTKDGIESSVTVKDFKRLRGIIRGNSVKVHILKKRGLPFKLKKYKKRAGLLLGSLFFLCFIIFMSGYIWVIDVEGNTYVKDREIISLCNEIGIKEGIKKDKINPKSQRETLLLKTDKLAWVSLNIEGCRLTVNVSEVKQTDNNTNACNLKASEDGIITKINVTAGNCIVNIDDVVKKGDLLVSGVVEQSDSTKFVNSTGKITAEVVKEINVSGKYKEEVTSPTGEELKRYVLGIFSLKVPLYLGSAKGEYNLKTEEERLMLFGTRLPITLYKGDFEFLAKEKITRNRESLEKVLKSRVNKIIEELEAESFTTELEEFTETEDGINLKLVIKAQKDIAVKEPLLISNTE